MIAYSLDTGEEHWRSKIGSVGSLPTHASDLGGFIPSPDLNGHPQPVVTDDTFILVAGNLIALNLNDGSELWRAKLKASVPNLKNSYAQPVLDNGTLLRNYMRYRGLDVGIQAGAYEVTGAMTIRDLALTLQTARPSDIVVTIVEGWRLEQIAEAIDAAGLNFTGPEFLAAARAPIANHELASVTDSLEGFLFPDTYRLESDSSPNAFLKTAMDNFIRRVDPSLRQSFELQGLTLSQAVTLASIVEREAIVPEERPMIAAVFLKRLRSGLPLEADPTVQYPLGQQPDGSWWKSPLSLLDLEEVSPFNTYRNDGLPPTPIAAPGLSSLEAVGTPIEINYLYFRAACDGSGRHQFAETFAQHLQNACP